MSAIDLNTDETACSAWIARFLEARGVDRIFGLQGGHIQPIWDHVARRGLRIIDVRDEGAAGNGWRQSRRARCRRQPQTSRSRSMPCGRRVGRW
jgi:Thiamine pyrophosphate enzyme, N-terminal TPP binding domain